MPIWVHYANNHADFCVSYELKKNTELSSCTFPVQYTEQRIDITGLTDNQVLRTLTRETKIQTAQRKKEYNLTIYHLYF